jgi:hypothetical protein
MTTATLLRMSDRGALDGKWRITACGVVRRGRPGRKESLRLVPGEEEGQETLVPCVVRHQYQTAE